MHNPRKFLYLGGLCIRPFFLQGPPVFTHEEDDMSKAVDKLYRSALHVGSDRAIDRAVSN